MVKSNDFQDPKYVQHINVNEDVVVVVDDESSQGEAKCVSLI